jgi:predicted nuclease of restriction endonuclease-like (RecB) superfamily
LRSFAEAWTDEKIVQQVVGKSPREHNLALLGKLKNSEDRICYAKKAIENNWSRNVLVMQIESKLIG